MKIDLEKIQTDYHQNDVCMSELLASTPADGLNMEEAFELYIKARKWADADKFFVHRDENDIEEL